MRIKQVIEYYAKHGHISAVETQKTLLSLVNGYVVKMKKNVTAILDAKLRDNALFMKKKGK